MPPASVQHSIVQHSIVVLYSAMQCGAEWRGISPGVLVLAGRASRVCAPHYVALYSYYVHYYVQYSMLCTLPALPALVRRSDVRPDIVWYSVV